MVQYTLDSRKPVLRKNLDLRKILATTDFLVLKLFDFLRPNVQFKKDFFPKSGKNRDFLAILDQFFGFFQIFSQLLAYFFHNSIYIA